jgi:hypothetical protein
VQGSRLKDITNLAGVIFIKPMKSMINHYNRALIKIAVRERGR